MPYRVAATDENALHDAEEVKAFARTMRKRFLPVQVVLVVLGVVALPATAISIFVTSRQSPVLAEEPRCHDVHVITVDSLGKRATERPITVCR